MDSIYLLDEFVITIPGEPYRLFPFGKIVKNGIPRFITPELAAKFRLPHFRPAIKLGSHREETPAGGHIIALQVREDGLYAVPEFNPDGLTALEKGAYRYHSPEVIWEGGFEDPKTGEIIEGPLIVGDALLHMPHLGEDAALYQIQPKESVMTDQYTVPKSLWDRFEAWLDGLTKGEVLETAPRQPDPEPDPTPDPAQSEAFQAAVAERDQFKAELEKLQAEREAAEKLAAIRAEFDTEEFGMSYIELGKSDEAARMLAGMTDEQRTWVLQNFKALSKQIDESALTGERGTAGAGVDAGDSPVEKLNAAILARTTEKEISYGQAAQEIQTEQPDLVKAAYG